MKARNHYLLENSALKFDGSGLGRRSKHDTFQSQYQLGEFHHHYNEPKKDFTKFFITAECCLQHLTIECRLYDSTFHTYQQIFSEQYPWKKDCL